MQEIKKYLKKKKDEASNKVIAFSMANIFKGFMSKERQLDLNTKIETAEKEYQSLRRMLEVLEGKTPEPSNDINDVYKHLSILLVEEIDRRVQTLDVQENEMLARLRVSELEFAHSQLKSSLWTFESQKYL